MKILLLPKYHREGPSSRYRTHNYLPYFKENHNVVIKPLFFDGYVKDLYQKNKGKKVNKVFISYLKRFLFIIKNKKKYDVLIIEKELFPYFPFIFEEILLKGTKYSLDFDDAISTKYKRNDLLNFFLGKKINLLSNSAFQTTVGNHWYWNEITLGNLKYLPTVIDIENYQISNSIRKENSIPIIVWIGSPSTVKYLEILKEVFLKLTEKHDFKLRIIGAELKIEGVNIEILKWSEEREFQDLYTADIGIMPLENTVWEFGKCGFKCIQYMAAELPVLASPLPANKEILNPGVTGFLPTNEKDWYEHLENLLSNKKLRKSMGSKGRERIEQHYTYQIWGDKYLNYIQSL